MYELTTQKLEIYPDAGGYRAIVKHYKQAAKLNKLLKHYPADVRFVDGDEVMFKFTPEQLASVKAVLRIKG